MHSSGDVDQALNWLTQLDQQYQLTDDNYGIADFIQDLKDKGFIKTDRQGNGQLVPGAKMEIALRKQALDDIFDQLKKSKHGDHQDKSYRSRG